jgi:peptidoglycan DL-endopeptidase CwlO
LSKHRRPSVLSRLVASAQRPMHVSIAAGVAGTVAVTGTVVAVADDGSTPTPRVGHVVAERPFVTGKQQQITMRAQRSGVLADTARESARERARETAREEARAAAAHRLAVARHRAKVRREKARRAAARRAAEARRRSEATASRSSSRGAPDSGVSASAGHVLALAAAAASGAYYVHGGDGPSAFDCSGFTQFVFAQVGVSLPHQSGMQRGVARSVSSPAPGDLVFVYNGGGGSIGHVAIYAGGGYWWEASNPSTGVGRHRAWSTHVSYGRVLT